jgi:PAS domain S-box-containing protein
MDVTARRATEARLRESQDRLLALIEGIPQLVWRAEGEGLWTWSSPQWTALTGLSEADSRVRGWLAAIHPDDRDAALQAWAAAMTSGRYEVDYRLRDAAGGRYRWFTTRASPLRDADGRIVEWLGTCTDVDDLRRLKEEGGLLLAELQHRVRNTLSVIRSIARRTARTTDTVDGYAMHLDGRIGAFARVQAAVTRDPAAGVDLAALVADELLAHAAHEGDGLRIAGPPVRLHPKPAETLGLAIHELATNAVKHGALSVPEGRIAVSWWLEDGHLCFEWRESGLPGPLPELTRRGFGTDLLERTLAYELKARVRREAGAEGLAWRIDLPVDARLIHGAAVT